MVRKSQNLKKVFKNLKILFSAKNANLLVLPIEEISIRPELSSPPRFRVQGGWSERERRTDGQMEILVSNIGCTQCT